MSTGSIDRVQSDLNAMREVLGLDRIWGMADVRFGYALAGCCALFATVRWPGSPLMLPMPWAFAIVLVPLTAWMIYVAIKSRTLPPREEGRRREYRFGLILAVCVLFAFGGYAVWAGKIGLSIAQSWSVFVAILGAASVIMGIAQQRPYRYPRGYWFAGGFPLVVLGVAFPLVPPQYRDALYGVMCFAAIGSASLMMRRHVMAAMAEEHARVTD